jgi:hypothetical protein
MLRTLEAVIDNHNHVQWLEHIQLHSPQRVLITLLDSAPMADFRFIQHQTTPSRCANHARQR